MANAKLLDYDSMSNEFWVEEFNAYAHIVGVFGFQKLAYYFKEHYADWKKK